MELKLRPRLSTPIIPFQIIEKTANSSDITRSKFSAVSEMKQQGCHFAAEQPLKQTVAFSTNVRIALDGRAVEIAPSPPRLNTEVTRGYRTALGRDLN